MYVLDKNGGQWAIDEGLRDRASQIIDNFDHLVGHVVLEQVIFMRLSGGKAKWHGTCYYIGKEPITILPKFVAYRLNEFGLLNLNNTSFDLEGMDIFDIRYVIAINDDAIGEADGDIQKVEDITLLHELMHIHPDGDKIVTHDLKDFSVLVAKFGPYWGNGQISDEGEEALLDAQLGGADEFDMGLPPPFVPKSGVGDTKIEESD